MFDRILIVRLSSFGDVALTLPLRVAFVAKGPHTWHRKRHASKGLQTLAGKEVLPAFRNWLERKK